MKRRNTPSKQAVLSMLKESSSALSQDMIEAKLKGVMDRVTIYRVLNSFCEDGITHRTLSDDGKYYYALCTGCSHNNHTHNHFHFRCLECAVVECLTQQVVVSLPEGYTMNDANCWVSGYCKACAV